MGSIRYVLHRSGAPGMRWLGLGPALRPSRALWKLQRLLDQHSFWATQRSLADLRRCLAASNAVVSAWQQKRLVGFGRASSDGVFRAVLWDVVVATDFQHQGIGRTMVETLLDAANLANVERIYLMTTNSSGFYRELGFRSADSQQLLVLRKNWSQPGNNASG
jgi:N-acetylglutamate synthase-like GNAT family acetyltransferase